MSDTPQSIVSDDEVTRVHGNANFGSMSKRDVLDEGVLKSAFGYSDGHTAHCILEEHGLIRRNRQRTYYPSLTKKGRRYLRSLFRNIELDEILKVAKDREAKP